MAAGYVGNGARSERDPRERLKHNKDEIDKMLRTTYGAKLEPDVNRRCREEILTAEDEEGAARAAAKIRMDLSIDISEAMIEASEELVNEALVSCGFKSFQDLERSHQSFSLPDPDSCKRNLVVCVSSDAE